MYRNAAVAVGLVLMAAMLRLLFLDELGSSYPFVIFYPAVLLAGLYGGLSAGLPATVFSAVLTCYLWVDPRRPLPPAICRTGEG